MARVEKTVFISYRRKDLSWALAVYQFLTSQKYDVFFDYTSLSGGDFEQVIVSNIRARAHFVLILTPTALDRCNEPGDWLRREIETAVDEKRNIIPLFFDGFNFGSPSIAEKLTGKLSSINRYNGLDVPPGYFVEAMERLRNRYLNIPLNAVIHPVSAEVRKVVKEEQGAVDRALQQKSEDIQELIQPAEEKRAEFLGPLKRGANDIKLRQFGIPAIILVIAALGVFGINSMMSNVGKGETQLPSQTALEIVNELKPTSTHTPPIPTGTAIVPSSTPTPELGIGSTFTAPKDGMVMVYVPAGNFIMGGESNSNEQPVHSVHLDAYWIDRTEVTNEMFAECVQDGGCNEPADTGYYSDPSYARHPVVYVSWYDANDYCSWAARQLPTEAEWEKAARGVRGFAYPWGNDSPNEKLMNYDSNIGDTTEVGNYPDGASRYGALDMAGNVWEWVADWYDETYYANSPDSNPHGPDSGEYRVLRGGSWSDSGSSIRSASRAWLDPTLPGNGIGFRCSRSP